MAPQDPRTTPRLGANPSYDRFNPMDHDTQVKMQHKDASMWSAKSAKKQVPKTAESQSRDGRHPPASTSVNPEFQGDEPDFALPSPPQSTKTYIQDPEDGRWKPTFLNEDYLRQDGVLSQELKNEVAKRMGPPARPGRGSSSSAGMFTNAEIKAISGGTFVNVAHIYEYDSPAQRSDPAYPIVVLGLQAAVSFVTRSNHLHCNHPPNFIPLWVPESTSASSFAIQLPLVYQEMRVAIGPLALWLFVKMWIQRRAMEHR